MVLLLLRLCLRGEGERLMVAVPSAADPAVAAAAAAAAASPGGGAAAPPGGGLTGPGAPEAERDTSAAKRH